ncbi:MAG: alpha/beta hydrolase [Clostridia bacterium]|nr:alpha/beta hydrolase [Clostridia bacterium]
MKKGIAALALGGALTAGAAYGALAFAGDLLFKRDCVPPAEFTEKLVDCDKAHLGDYLQKNLQWVESYGYDRHFMLSDRGERLVGYHLKPEKESKIFVFAAHGYRSYGKKEFCGVGQYYIEKGYNLFMVDHVASGESEGTYCTFGYNETKDCLKWLSYMIETFGEDIKIILHGVSMGAATVMLMNGSGLLPENVKMTVADCGFTSGPEFFAYRVNMFSKAIPAKGLVKAWNKVNKGRTGFDLFEVEPIKAVERAEKPMLFIHGEQDGLVPCFMVYELYESCASREKELVVIGGADHAQSYMVGKEKYTEKLGSFIDSHIDSEVLI